MADSTEITAGFSRVVRESTLAKRALRLHFLLSFPGAEVFGVAGFAFFSWLIIGMGIAPAEIGALAMFALLPGVFLPLLRPAGGYGSLSAVAIVALGVAGFAAGCGALLIAGSPGNTHFRLFLLCIPVLMASLFHSMLSASAEDRLDAILSGHRGERFREMLGFQTAAAGAVVLLLAGISVDVSGIKWFPSYAVVFVVSLILLFPAFFLLKTVPPVPAPPVAPNLPVSPSPGPDGSGSSPALVFLDIAMSFVSGILPVFLLVFMISPRYLGMHLSLAALYVVLFLAFTTVGRAFWHRIGERFGARPVLQFALPLLAAVLLPLALIGRKEAFLLAPLLGLAGFLFAGMAAGMDRAFGIFSGGRKAFPRVYAAHGWYGAVVFALAPFAAGLALNRVRSGSHPFPGSTGDVQVVFVAAASALVLAFPLLLCLGSRYGLSLARAIRTVGGGNPFLFAWNALFLLRARSEEERVRALRGLGRSGNPLAVPSLLEALGDPSPEVRRNAISALGRIRAVEAVLPLMGELQDRESDMRCEAAEALGRIGDRAALAPLLGVLGDRDFRLRTAAITALAGIGGDDIRDRLYELFVISYDTDIFPTLADSLSRLGSREIVEPVMRRLGEYESLMLRLQLLNAVCRSLGAGNTFYRILSRHEYARVDEVNRLIRQARRHVRHSPLFRKDTVSGMNRILGRIAESYRSEDHHAFLRSVWEFIAYMQLVVPDFTPPESETRIIGCGSGSPLRPHIEAVNRFLLLKETEDIRDEGMVFLVICINCLLAAGC